MTKKAPNEEISYQYSKEVLGFITLCLLLGLYICRHFFPLWNESGMENNYPPSIIIEIEGEVLNPGIYFFYHPPKIIEALAKSSEIIAPHQIISPPLISRLSSGTLLKVNKTPEGIKISLLPLEGKKKILFEIPININTAKVEDLSNLPSIGPGISRGIIAYRNKYGYFQKVEDLKKVKGIGEKRFKGIKRYLTVEADIF